MADPNATACAACGATGELHEHHLVPRVHGGADLPTVMLCMDCHGAVHGYSLKIDSTKHRDLTKAGLAAARARGVKLGNPKLAEYAKIGRMDQKRKARRKVREIIPHIRQARLNGCSTLAEIAEALNARGIKTPGGCSSWSAEQVRRIEKAAATLGP